MCGVATEVVPALKALIGLPYCKDVAIDSEISMMQLWVYGCKVVS